MTDFLMISFNELNSRHIFNTNLLLHKVVNFDISVSPWDKCTGWLGVKLW